MGRTLSERSFQPTQSISIHCRSEKTSMAFRHLATIFKNGQVVGEGRIPYQNRTWESYEFQSVMQQAVNKSSLTPQEKDEVKKWLEGDRTDWSGFHMTGAIAKMGDVFAQKPEEKVAWKKRMLKAGLGNQGLDLSALEGVPIEEQSKRLDMVIEHISKAGKPAQTEKKKKLKSQIKSSGLDISKETKGWD